MEVPKVNHNQNHSSHPITKASAQLLTTSKNVDAFAKGLEGEAFQAPVSGQLTMQGRTIDLLNHPTKVAKHANKAAKQALLHNQNFPRSRL